MFYGYWVFLHYRVFRGWEKSPTPVAKLTSLHLSLSKTGNGRGGGLAGIEVTTQIMAGADGEQI